MPSRADELAAELGPAVAGTLAVSTSGRVAVPDQRHSEGVLVSFQPAGSQAKSAAGAVSRGWSVISTSWSEPDVRALLGLDEEARQRKVAVVVGAGFSPGLGALLASHGAKSLDLVDEIHLTRAGSAGPADARCYHAALSERSLDWFDGSWLRRPGGSGRQLSYFPEPIGPRDCYRAGLVDSLLLRLTLAEQATGAKSLADHIEALRARFDASKRRGDTTHQGEEARFVLYLLKNPARGLKLAQANWAVQREPRDARILLEAALASRDLAAAEPVREMLRHTGLEDQQLVALVNRLDAL